MAFGMTVAHVVIVAVNRVEELVDRNHLRQVDPADVESPIYSVPQGVKDGRFAGRCAFRNYRLAVEYVRGSLQEYIYPVIGGYLSVCRCNPDIED